MAKNQSEKSGPGSISVTGARGFVLVEILIALSIMSIVLLSVISGVTSSIYVISGMKNSTRAMMIARNHMNDFILRRMRGTDLRREALKEYPGFSITRVTMPFEHPMINLGPLATVKKTEIAVTWQERGRDREYSIFYIYQAQ